MLALSRCGGPKPYDQRAGISISRLSVSLHLGQEQLKVGQCRETRCPHELHTKSPLQGVITLKPRPSTQ
jgi:hypothetical protein